MDSFEWLDHMCCEVSRQLAALDPALLTAREAARASAGFVTLGKLADAGSVLVAGRAAQADPAGASGLARAAGISRADAERAIATSKAVAELPATRQAMVEGQLSRAQAALTAEAASASPESEASLLESASRQDLVGLRRHAERVKAACGDEAARRAKAHANRHTRTWVRDGEWHMHASGTVEAGARIEFAHRPFWEAALDEAPKGDRREPFGAYGFDGLVAMAEAAADIVAQPEERGSAPATNPSGDNDGGGGGDGGSNAHGSHTAGDLGKDGGRHSAPAANPAGDHDGGRGGDGGGNVHGDGDSDSGASGGGADDVDGVACAGRKRLRRRRWQGVVRVDASAIRRSHTVPGEVCEIVGVGPIDVPTAVALLGDATVRVLVKDGHDVLAVATTSRYRPPDLDVAVAERSNWECANRDCSNASFIEIDHDEMYSHTHDTSYANLHPLCGRCHDLKTYKGCRIVDHGRGTVVLVAPDDPDPP